MAFVDPDEVKAAAPQKSGGGFVDPDEAPTTKVPPLSQSVKGLQQRQGAEFKSDGKTTAAGTALRAGGEVAATVPGSMYAAGVGSELGTIAMPAVAAIPYVGPFIAPWMPAVGGAAGGLISSVAQSYGINTLEEFADNVFGTNIAATKKAQAEQYPTAEKIGQLAGMVAGPGGALVKAKDLFTKEGAKTAAIGAGTMVGIGGAQRAIEGQPVLSSDMVWDAASGTLVSQSKLGTKLFEKGRTAVTSKPAVKPPTEPLKPEFKEPVVSDIEKTEFVDKLKAEKAKADATVPVVKAAIKHKETGAVTELGAYHPKDLKDSTADTHEQGFVDANGTFLNRKDSWNRAKTAGQIPEDHKATNIKDGLHSTDLRVAGDVNFKVAEIPSEVNGIPVVEGSTGRTRSDGRAVGSTTFRNKDGTPKEIVIDTGTLHDQFAEKPWTKPQVEGVFPIAADAFKTPQEYIDFVIEHEHQHTLVPKYEGQTKASYENQTNKAALEALAEKKASDKAAGVVEAPVTSKRAVETPPSTDPTLDRTKTSPRDVASEQEMFEIASDIYAKHGETEAVKFYEGFREYQKTWPDHVGEVEKFVNTNLINKIAAERVTSNNVRDMKEAAGKDVDLNKLTYDIDKGAPLEGKAKDIATKFRELMDELGKRAMDNGVIKGWHENYVARNVVAEGAAPPTAVQEFLKDMFGTGSSASGGTKTTTKYGQPRRLETREDLVNHIEGINKWLADKGLDYRFKLKTDNLADIYHDYAASVEKAIENKNLVTSIKQIRNVAGESLIKPITPENPLPYGWKTMENPELAGQAIHPDLVPALKFVFDAGPGDWMKAIGHVSQLTKRIAVVGSFFHAKSMMEVMSSAQIPIWTPVKEAIVLPLIERGVKAFTGKELELSAITKAVNQFKKGGLGDEVDMWIKDGVMFEIPEDVFRGVLTSTGKFADSMIGKFGPKTRALESTLSLTEKYTLGLFDKYTWDYLHTGGKLMVANAYLDKARLQAAKEGKPFDEAQQRKEIARFVNDSFGGVNWFDAATQTQTEFGKRMAMAAYSPEGRRALQAVLFAPDWTLSTIRAFTAALPKELNPTKWQPVEGVKGMMAPTTKADYARLYQFKTALTYLTLINAINMMTAGRPVWDNKDPTRIEWPDGTSMQAMKHAMEPYHWISDPDKTLANKLGFIPKAIIVGGGGLEYASPQADKLIDRSLTGRAEAVAKMALPFQIQAASNAPEGEGLERAAYGTLGFPVYGQTPEQRKASKAARAKALKQAAKEYHEKAKEKGWEQ